MWRAAVRSTHQRFSGSGTITGGVTAQARRHRAVERVDAQLDAADEVVDVADAEQVARAIVSSASAAVAQPTTSYICGLAAPSEPPMAIPSTGRAAIACVEPTRRSS